MVEFINPLTTNMTSSNEVILNSSLAHEYLYQHEDFRISNTNTVIAKTHDNLGKIDNKLFILEKADNDEDTKENHAPDIDSRENTGVKSNEYKYKKYLELLKLVGLGGIEHSIGQEKVSCFDKIKCKQQIIDSNLNHNKSETLVPMAETAVDLSNIKQRIESKRNRRSNRETEQNSFDHLDNYMEPEKINFIISNFFNNNRIWNNDEEFELAKLEIHERQKELTLLETMMEEKKEMENEEIEEARQGLFKRINKLTEYFENNIGNEEKGNNALSLTNLKQFILDYTEILMHYKESLIELANQEIGIHKSDEICNLLKLEIMDIDNFTNDRGENDTFCIAEKKVRILEIIKQLPINDSCLKKYKFKTEIKNNECMNFAVEHKKPIKANYAKNKWHMMKVMLKSILPFNLTSQHVKEVLDCKGNKHIISSKKSLKKKHLSFTKDKNGSIRKSAQVSEVQKTKNESLCINNGEIPICLDDDDMEMQNERNMKDINNSGKITLEKIDVFLPKEIKSKQIESNNAKMTSSGTRGDESTLIQEPLQNTYDDIACSALMDKLCLNEGIFNTNTKDVLCLESNIKTPRGQNDTPIEASLISDIDSTKDTSLIHSFEDKYMNKLSHNFQKTETLDNSCIKPFKINLHVIKNSESLYTENNIISADKSANLQDNEMNTNLIPNNPITDAYLCNDSQESTKILPMNGDIERIQTTLINAAFKNDNQPINENEEIGEQVNNKRFCVRTRLIITEKPSGYSLTRKVDISFIAIIFAVLCVSYTFLL